MTGVRYPWIVAASAIVNQYYCYGLDLDFGPFFVKFSSYFPYGAKLCFNGHHWAQRQAQQAGIAFTALDNGWFLECEQPERLQRIWGLGRNGTGFSAMTGICGSDARFLGVGVCEAALSDAGRVSL